MHLYRLFAIGLLLILPALAQRPLAYDISLRLDPGASTFTGSVLIDFELTAPAKALRLHAVDLKIEKILIDGVNATSQPAPDEQIEILFAQQLPKGNHKLRIDYSAPLSDKAKLGPNRRRSEAGDWYAFTTFTPIEARRAFPCFDEPRFKTPFQFTLEIPAKMTAATNTPLLSESAPKTGWKTLRFAPSQAIATEVVAFTVGPWQIAVGASAGSKKIPTRILYPAKSDGNAAPAVKAAPELVARLEAYTGIPYPWDKLDQVALLENAFGAVENPGLITYKSQLLLAKPDGVSRMRGVMTHELTHQWFGNLVTQATWQDVFLSEGFATLIGNKLAELDLPVSERGQKAAAQRNEMLDRDATSASRVVRAPKQARSDMKDVYGPEVYQKAGAILRMIENWLGEDTMQRGLQLYLKRHAGGNATVADLSAALKEVSGKDVAAVLDSFLNRTGVPRVALDLNCTSTKPTIKVDVAEGWTAPVCVRTPAGESCQLIKGSGLIPLNDKACPVWLVPNAGGTGYFRTTLKNGPATHAPWTAVERIALDPKKETP